MTVWIGTAEACELLGVVPRTLYRCIDEGKLPAYRFGRVIRIREIDLFDFIEGCRIEPGTVSHLYPEGKPTLVRLEDAG